MTFQSIDRVQPRIVINSKAVALIILAVFATALAPFIGEAQRNFLVIGVSALTPLFLVAFSLPLRREMLWSGAVVCYMISVSIIHGTKSDIPTIAYTMLFIIPYLFFVGCLTNGNVNLETMVTFLRRLILAFGALSVVQFCAAFFGLPVPNEVISKGLGSHNSLAVEPSHLARVLAVSMFVYLVLRRTEQNPGASPLKLLFQECLVFSAFLTSISLSGSTLAVLSAPLALMLVFKARWTMVLLGFGLMVLPFIQTLEIDAIERGTAFVAALPTMDVWNLANADHSGSVRVMPVLIYLDETSPSTSEFWFGAGLSEVSRFLEGKVIGVGEGFQGGFFPAFNIAFGMIGFALMTTAFIFRFLHPRTLPFIFFWFLMFFATPWNTQLFWYGLMMLRVLYHFEVNLTGKGKKQTLTPGQALDSQPATLSG